MSESSTKRSRKTKLVPRQCVDVDDENIADLQKKGERRKKKKNKPKMPPPTQIHDFEALIDSQTMKADTSPPLFSITVAVEECDESSSELMIIEPKDETVEISSSDSEAENDFSDNNAVIKLGNTQTNDLANKGFKALVLDREEILNATNKILEESNNTADRMLGIEVRNCIGKFESTVKNYHNTKIDKVLIQWQAWQRMIQVKFRSTPLFYKCYICEKSWWYLHDFQEHLKCHDSYNLDLEEYTMDEANIIAYSHVDDILDTKHFNTEGDCPKCGNEYAIHKSTNRVKNSLYSCKVKSCYKLFNTCFTLRSHEYMSHTISELTGVAFQPGRQSKNCEVCGFVFHSQESYQSHMNLMHSVRSDSVVVQLYASAKHKRCLQCRAELYGPTIYHHQYTCRGSFLPWKKCKFCYRSFHNGQLYKNHMGESGKYPCKVCNIMLTRECLEVDHLLTHSDKFMVVKKCVVCEDFKVFLSDAGALNHLTAHIPKRTEESYTKYVLNILVPKSCVTEKLELKQSVTIEEEPTEAIIAPELEIKQEILESFETTIDDDEDSEMQIKEEIDIEENFIPEKLENSFKITSKVEDDSEMHSRIFGIKIEASDIEVKQETQEEEEYEDDIIKLDCNFLENMQQSMENGYLEVEGTVVDMPETISNDENTQEMNEESDEDMEESTEEGRKRLPKIYRCNRCGFDAVHKEYRAHLRSHCSETLYDRKDYTCTKCYCTFDTFEKFIDHFTKHNLNPMACPECYKTFEDYETLQVHLASHIRLTFITVQLVPLPGSKDAVHYRCKMCDKTVGRMSFFEHWEEHLSFVEINDEKVMEEDDPMKGIVDQDMLEELLQRLQCPGTMFSMRRGCPICLRHFDRRNDYKRHLVEHLLNDAYTKRPEHGGLKCQICIRCFQKPDHYKKHMRDHGALKDYRCDICDKNFSDSSNYTKHKKLHNANAFTCDICRKKFQIKISLEKHMELHNNQKPIVCAACNKTFSLESTYKKHARMYHEKERQKFACMVCRKRFHSLKDKWDHQWLVHEERKHKADCPKCPNSYRRFRDLKTHMKVDHYTDFHYINVKKGNAGMKVIGKKINVDIPETSRKKETLIVYV